MTENIIQMKGRNLERELEVLLKLNRKGLVSDFAMIYMTPPVEEDKSWSSGVMNQYWFGGTSSILVLGMVERLQKVIMNWIEGDEDS